MRVTPRPLLSYASFVALLVLDVVALAAKEFQGKILAARDLQTYEF